MDDKNIKMIQPVSEFENEALSTDLLPDVLSIEYKKLAPSYKTYALVSTTITFGIIFLLALVILLFAGQLYSFYRIILFFAGFGVLYVARMIIRYYGYGKKGYAIRRHDVLYKSGIWWKRNIYIPKNRIQHVEIKKSPLEDIFGIARLKIFTAGGSGSDMVIPGLLPDVAQRLKENMMQKIADDQEE